ncbi:hypothetical protein SCOCK_150130 [Actinacidiphila cocklensis]|uniref:Uncharacterized protein n=1 Tax=Actinacidiphila cocklensis TaxID=887465 RepID=A0A9W4GP98_9ACTN|nr:hypothetical protein SCOCK_150130 [Actinacidiphila cocklensis]
MCDDMDKCLRRPGAARGLVKERQLCGSQARLWLVLNLRWRTHAITREVLGEYAQLRRCEPRGLDPDALGSTVGAGVAVAEAIENTPR